MSHAICYSKLSTSSKCLDVDILYSEIIGILLRKKKSYIMTKKIGLNRALSFFYKIKDILILLKLYIFLKVLSLIFVVIFKLAF